MLMDGDRDAVFVMADNFYELPHFPNPLRICLGVLDYYFVETMMLPTLTVTTSLLPLRGGATYITGACCYTGMVVE